MLKSFAIAIAALATTTVCAHADVIAALGTDGTLQHIDPQARRVTKTVTISGVDGPVAGIDRRPADGKLYALSYSGAVFTVDPATGAATRVSLLRVAPPAGGAVTVDFNPVANRLRIIGSNGANLRANVDDGAVTVDQNLKYAAGGEAPKVIAGAYTNSVAGAKETALLDIDATGQLLKQAPPNDGVLTPVGALGAAPAVIAFDIVTTGETNAGWAVAGGALHTIDLATGAATSVGRIRGLRGEIRDIAILPSAP